MKCLSFVLCAVFVAVVVGLFGCDNRADRSESPDSREATPRRSAATTTATATAEAPATAGPTGIVRGRVTFKGVAPEPEEIPGAKCHSGAAATSVAPVVVSGAGGLKDVMVYVKDAPESAPATGAAPAVLNQVNCQYVPHVIGVRTGQVLRVKSSDPTLHNVHALCVDNPAVNFGLTGAGQGRDLTFGVSERFEVKCDVHPWMRAHVYVFDHPLFAVTGDDGRFEITGLPPGGHTLVYSHPFLGDRERAVTVGAGADGAAPSAVADLVFEKGRQ